MTFAFTTKPPDLPDWPFADYTYPAKWNGMVLVGEAPGAEEARQGKPFVGRSGQLLDKILAQAGIDRAECLIANVFRRRPPKNKVDQFFVSRRQATLQGIAVTEEFGRFGTGLCRQIFADDIHHLGKMLVDKKPKLIVALGRTPLWALTGESGLMNIVGQPLPCRLAAGLTVITTYHPSFILRGNWGLQGAWLGHFLMAKDKMGQG